eukprot:1887149-Amphidinium_carterae.1
MNADCVDGPWEHLDTVCVIVASASIRKSMAQNTAYDSTPHNKSSNEAYVQGPSWNPRAGQAWSRVRKSASVVGWHAKEASQLLPIMKEADMIVKHHWQASSSCQPWRFTSNTSKSA